MLNHDLALALPARILALAEAAGLEEILAPCAACFNRLASARAALEADPAKRQEIVELIELPYSGRVRVLNILEVLERYRDRIEAKTVNAFRYKVACYYGCLLVRPPEVVKFDRPENPQSMDRLLATSAPSPSTGPSRPNAAARHSPSPAPISWRSWVAASSPTRPGARRGHRGGLPDVPVQPGHAPARDRRSCSRNSDIPVLYVTQAIGLALGIDAKQLGLQRHLVPVELPEPELEVAATMTTKTTTEGERYVTNRRLYLPLRRKYRRTVDCQEVAARCKRMPGVVHSVDYKYMCSDPGQNMIKEAIREQKLTGVVVAACSPRMHEPTFRRAVSEAGLNPYLCEMANLREHCSWVHEKGDGTTDKAIDLVVSLVEKVKRNKPLLPIKVPVTKTALVMGGGIAGIQAALDIANAGHKVILVERRPPSAATWRSSPRPSRRWTAPSAS